MKRKELFIEAIEKVLTMEYGLTKETAAEMMEGFCLDMRLSANRDVYSRRSPQSVAKDIVEAARGTHQV